MEHHGMGKPACGPHAPFSSHHQLHPAQQGFQCMTHEDGPALTSKLHKHAHAHAHTPQTAVDLEVHTLEDGFKKDTCVDPGRKLGNSQVPGMPSMV